MEPLFSKLLPDQSHYFFAKNIGINKNDLTNIKINGLNHVSKSTNESLIRVANYFHTSVSNLIFLNQTHSSSCVIFDNNLNAGENKLSPLIFDGDAIVSNIADKVLCITTADCAPILFWDKKEKIVGAVHLGWRGALSDLLEATLVSFEKLGSKRENLIAVLGPTIGKNMYEVKDDFLFLFKGKDPNYSTFFKTDKIITFDLPGFLLSRLEKLGIRKFDFLEKCTFKNDKSFFSHRRATLERKIEMGRQISAIQV